MKNMMKQTLEDLCLRYGFSPIFDIVVAEGTRESSDLSNTTIAALLSLPVQFQSRFRWLYLADRKVMVNLSEEMSKVLKKNQPNIRDINEQLQKLLFGENIK